jgi:hypothetical protein
VDPIVIFFGVIAVLLFGMVWGDFAVEERKGNK